MNNVQKINYSPLGADLRIIIDDDQKIWFVASDIAKILEYASAKDLIRGLDDDERGGRKVPTLGGEQQMSFAIDDFDPLYGSPKLIFHPL